MKKHLICAIALITIASSISPANNQRLSTTRTPKNPAGTAQKQAAIQALADATKKEITRILEVFETISEKIVEMSSVDQLHDLLHTAADCFENNKSLNPNYKQSVERSISTSKINPPFSDAFRTVQV